MKRASEEFIWLEGGRRSVWLEKMDVFYTSSTEGLPNVVIEAQGFGVPVVSTNVGVLVRLWNQGKPEYC